MSASSAETTKARFQAVISQLHSLLDVIEQEVTATISARDPYTVSPELAIRPTSELLDAYRKFGHTSDELALFASDPSDHVAVIAGGFYESKALLAVSEFGVANVLGTSEVALTEVAAKVNADPVRLRQCMRSLVNRRVFRETSFGSDVFANNRISSILLSAHERNLNGLIAHWADDAYRAAISLVPSIKVENSHKPAFDHYHGKTLWEWHKTPEGAQSRERTNQTMVGAEPMLHGSLIYDYDWLQHGEDFTIVDVGGGVGGAAIEFTRRFPKIKVIIQDQPSVLESAPKFWDERAPECKPRVTFMPHDFFNPQPVLPISPKIFFMRFILHDWPDDGCVRLLQPIHAAMTAEGVDKNAARLYIADVVLDEDSSRFKYMASLQMMTLVGAFERTEAQFREVLGRANFNVKKVWKNRGYTSLIEAVPA